MGKLFFKLSPRLFVLLLVVVGGVVLAIAFGPVPQPLAYHRFADVRRIFGVPRAFDVLSNLPFVLVGIAGLFLSLRKARRHLHNDAVCAFAIMFAGLLLTGFGSAYYHLQPDNHRLVWDRLPMTLVMTGFLSLLAIDRSKSRMLWIVPAIGFVGMGTVLQWWWSEVHGKGDLRWYVLFQALAILIGVLLLILFPVQKLEATGALAIAVAGNVLAKVFELLDRPIYRIGGIVSGHTLKHLAAGLAFLPIVYWMATLRIPSGTATPEQGLPAPAKFRTREA